MGTWIKAVPPKMLHDQFGIYQGQWQPEMDRAWLRTEDGVMVCSRLIRTEMGNVEHVTITRKNDKGYLSTDGTGGFSWSEKQEIKDELFGKNRVAVEVYPTEDRLVDVADVYHLWVFNKKYRLPFGIHPKEYRKAINRGYSMTNDELVQLQKYYDGREEYDGQEGSGTE